MIAVIEPMNGRIVHPQMPATSETIASVLLRPLGGGGLLSYRGYAWSSGGSP